MRKARIWRAFLIKERKFSENANAWLTWEGSNSHIPNWKKPIEMSGEFSLLSPEFELGDFCSHELRILNTHPSPKILCRVERSFSSPFSQG